MSAHRIVIMGVAGSGKTSVGERLAAATGYTFIDGDTLHPPANIEKMSAGTPLDDNDRWPWLARVGEVLAGREDGIITGCSALKRSYRDAIRKAAGAPVLFVHLSGNRALIAERMLKRRGHFMPPSLLESQFAALEPPGADEDAITIDIAEPMDSIIDRLTRELKGKRHG